MLGIGQHSNCGSIIQLDNTITLILLLFSVANNVAYSAIITIRYNSLLVIKCSAVLTICLPKLWLTCLASVVPGPLNTALASAVGLVEAVGQHLGQVHAVLGVVSGPVVALAECAVEACRSASVELHLAVSPLVLETCGAHSVTLVSTAVVSAT
jgi:hypothetical protein